MQKVESILEKIKYARKEKGYSQENMAQELGISQAAYTNIEKNESKLTIERFIGISKILEKPIHYYFEPIRCNYCNQIIDGKTNFNQKKYDRYHEKLEAQSKIIESYSSSIQNLKEEILFLRSMISILY